jgi:hypothetical protein
MAARVEVFLFVSPILSCFCAYLQPGRSEYPLEERSEEGDLETDVSSFYSSLDKTIETDGEDVVVNDMRDAVSEESMLRGAILARDGDAPDLSDAEHVALEKEKEFDYGGLRWAWSFKPRNFGLTGFSRDHRLVMGVTICSGIVQ